MDFFKGLLAVCIKDSKLHPFVDRICFFGLTILTLFIIIMIIIIIIIIIVIIREEYSPSTNVGWVQILLLLVLSPTLRGFSLGSLVFPSLLFQKFINNS